MMPYHKQDDENMTTQESTEMSDLHALEEAADLLSDALHNVRKHGDSNEATRAGDHIEAAEKLLEMEIKRLS